MSISQNFPNVVPSLNLNFVRSKKLDPRITFDRSTTATRMNSLGLIETVSANVPRFDHSYNSSTTSVNSLGLLIESQRTNLLQYSQAPATSPWQIFNNGGSSIVNNSATAPDGTTTAALFTAGTAADSIYQDVGSLSGTGTYTLSVFLKAGTCQNVVLSAFSLYNTTPNFAGISFNPVTGQIINTNGTVRVQTYPNGWYKISATGAGNNALNTAVRFQIYLNTTGTVYLWGAQLEEGLFSTSYIPTTNSQVTRNADYASITGTNFSNFFNNTEGTSLVIYQKSYQQENFTLPLYPTVFCFNGWPSRITYADYGGPYQEMNVVVSTVFQAQLLGPTSTRPTNTTLKYAGAYKQDDFAAMGTERVLYTDNSGSIPTLNAAFIGNENLSSISPLNGHIAQILYYPKRLTNTQLQEITK